MPNRIDVIGVPIAPRWCGIYKFLDDGSLLIEMPGMPRPDPTLRPTEFSCGTRPMTRVDEAKR